ncbi:PREDICTED: ATP synthase subunit gamma, mitochondrial [Thamnophis sirtalis]|uniref:ATP synthase F(1) complex subunit gamma, mitochondrial n=1 Tax=Thamnophis sirtalis TaxID=35019 RepID=A0A6I9YVP4_9SAUR|nr:PREDICTED: ATP synthase subunit gamma, mitochondrial [Thamnophis sirtalis]
MATLKDITRRLKSIKNIQKITKSMKMVAAAKYSRAERELKPARVYGVGALALYEKVDIKPPEDKKKHLLVGVSSDRGLCGAIHTSVAKEIKHQFSNLTGAGKEVMVVGIGDKLRTILQSPSFVPPPFEAEMIDKLTLRFNRTRQAVITKELIEIISGAAAL